ncbi:MAG TPA: GNAT family N-acetyltransferase [Candidatus Krumholzibacteria bacterium]|nr:GNAT family N-acetyltransferase [Candidatus Krumholzibacteria bacterium]
MTKKRSTKTATAPEQASLSLAEATQKDARTWRAMREDLYSDIPPEFHDAEMALMLASDDRACLLVRDPDDEAVGFIEVSLRNVVDGCLGGPVGYIEGIYLVPNWRGLGLGPAMIEAAATWFRAQGCRDMATDAEIDNDDAQQFWSELGFEETWRVVHYHKPLNGTPPPKRSGARRPSSSQRTRRNRRRG